MTAQDYHNFDLTFEATVDSYAVRVTDSPAGQAAAPSVFPFEPLEFENYLLRLGQRSSATRRTDSPEIPLSKQFGERLFDALFKELFCRSIPPATQSPQRHPPAPPQSRAV